VATGRVLQGRTDGRADTNKDRQTDGRADGQADGPNRAKIARLVLFKPRDKSSPVNFAKYDIKPYEYR